MAGAVYCVVRGKFKSLLGMQLCGRLLFLIIDALNVLVFFLGPATSRGVAYLGHSKAQAYRPSQAQAYRTSLRYQLRVLD